MVTRKEDTPKRISNRKYEKKNKEERRKAHANFQTMIPRELFNEINEFIRVNKLSKVDFIKKAYEMMKNNKNSGM